MLAASSILGKDSGRQGWARTFLAHFSPRALFKEEGWSLNPGPHLPEKPRTVLLESLVLGALWGFFSHGWTRLMETCDRCPAWLSCASEIYLWMNQSLEEGCLPSCRQRRTVCQQLQEGAGRGAEEQWGIAPARTCAITDDPGL